MRTTFLKAAIAVWFVLPGAGTLAQNKETLARFATEPHTGPVEQSLVGVSATFHGKSGDVLEVRRGNGMVLRCDGFVLFPMGLLLHRQDEPDDIRPDVQIYLRLDKSPERRPAPWPAHIPSAVPLRMVKLTNVHAPAQRTLLPDVLQPGDALTVAWRPWDPEKSAYGLLQKRTVHYAGRVTEKTKVAVCRCREPLAEAPAGAMVLGPEELAVGIVPATSGAAPLEFVSMEALRSVTNCVVPVPTPDAAFGALQSRTTEAPPDLANDAENAKRAAGGMVRIPGGPVALLRSVLRQQDEMQGATVACLPPFDIDHAEVTNAQYWEWWNKLPAKTAADLKLRMECRPLGWASEGVAFPDDIKDTPVLGVSFHAAETFARAHGKRLPTPYEWCLAALGPNGESAPPAWMAQYIEDRRAAALRIKEAHLEFLANHLKDVNAESFIHPTATDRVVIPVPNRRGIKFQDIPDPRIHRAHFFGYVPWILYPETLLSQGAVNLGANSLYRLQERMTMQAFSKRAIDHEVEIIWNTYKSPMRVLPAGSREFDTSVLGVSDMLFNAHEYVVAPPFGVRSEGGYTLYVNWVGLSSKELGDDYLVVRGSEKVETYLPPSRIIQNPRSPRLARWMQIGLNIGEAKSLFSLTAGWSFEMGPEPLYEQREVQEAFPWNSQFPHVQGEFPVWLHPGWSGKLARNIREIGSAADIDRLAEMPEDAGPTGYAFVTMTLLRPVGFRCAR